MMTSPSRYAIVSSSCLRPLHPKQPSRLVVIQVQAAKRCRDSLVTKIVKCGCVDCDTSKPTHPHCLIDIFLCQKHVQNTFASNVAENQVLANLPCSCKSLARLPKM